MELTSYSLDYVLEEMGRMLDWPLPSSGADPLLESAGETSEKAHKWPLLEGNLRERALRGGESRSQDRQGSDELNMSIMRRAR